jgi:hypothetical protein
VSRIVTPLSRSAAEIQFCVQVAANYRFMAVALDNAPERRRLPLTIRRLSRIARRAAIAEEIHPDSPERGCGICGNTTTCVAV